MIHCCKFTPKLWLWCRDSSNRWEMEGGSPTKFARPNRGYYRFWPAGSVECEESLSTVAKCRVCRSCWHCFCSKQCSCATPNRTSPHTSSAETSKIGRDHWRELAETSESNIINNGDQFWTTAWSNVDWGSELLFTVSQSGKIASLIQAGANYVCLGVPWRGWVSALKCE